MLDNLPFENVGLYQSKIPRLVLICLAVILIVLLRLYYLQVIKGSDYRRLSQNLTIREIEIKAQRGFVYDRNGQLLAENRLYYEIAVIPQYMTDVDRTLKDLAKLLDYPLDQLVQSYQKFKTAPYRPVVLIDDASFDRVAKLVSYKKPDYSQQTNYFLEGVEVRKNYLRHYLHPEAFSHALGYLKEIDKQTLLNKQKSSPKRYSRGDFIGASGLEAALDLNLRGYDGMKALVVDAKGRKAASHPDLELLQKRASFEPINGQQLYTTLDFDAQMAAYQAMKNRRGAIVALHPLTGEVLSFLSSPGFNANKIIKNVDKKYWQKINLDEDKYLFNRTLQAAYPPGSIHKFVAAYAGLDTETIDLETSFHCPGGLKFGKRYFKCWKRSGHGKVDLMKALAQSCDVFFYHLGLKLGVDQIAEYARQMGLGQKTHIEPPYERSGLIPTQAWKKKRYQKDWLESETLSVVIGQGYNLVTPLQAAQLMALIANGGHAVSPHLVKRFLDDQGEVLAKRVNSLKLNSLKSSIVKDLQEGAIQVVHGHGTARRLRSLPYKIAGKTGTSQVVSHDSKLKKTKRTQSHAWFIGYAPYDKPRIAIAVLVENGGSGGAVAAPIAGQVIKAYLQKHEI